ncbi:uncharacterized protein Dana_GF27189 [Drosophila ananassae]|uniref:Uncharacterized protein n=1 Tax=Drosophila ananassae TaxID=7217 RepID=A0A0P8Y1N1_DROAN|nr:uncharacterized protein Dana_GF27189 [Drosophila ananassae]
MYKHTVKSKLAQVRSNPPAEAPPAATGHLSKHGLGAGKKFFSHIRHKIEDNLTPKLSGKLYYKGSKHTRSMSALSTVDGGCVGGKYTPKGVALNPIPLQMPTSVLTSSVYSYIDSDEESQLSLSLSLTQQSLEDEIFAELEKVAHDETKLNEVLQSFDHLLNEYHPPVAEELPAPPAEFCDRQPMLSKSHSTLSINRNISRMQVYQSPELAGSVLLMRGGGGAGATGGGDSRYNSLNDLNGSRIPLRKQSNLRKRSESFCLEQPLPVKAPGKQQRTRSLLTLNTVARGRAPAVQPPPPAAVTMPKRANSSLEKRHITASKATPRRANSTVKPGTTKAKSPNAHSDELLVKCLAKGQEILRQVESMNHKPKRSSSRGVTKEHSQLVRNKKKLQKLQYANEEKVGRPKLESCKIIPPKLGETSDKNQELLVKVVQEVKVQKHPLKKPTKEIRAEQAEDSDDSGHISNTQLSTSTSTSNSTGSLCESEGDESAEERLPQTEKPCCKSNKIAELLQKFEAVAAKEKPSATPSPVVASKVVAQVQAVRCIQTQVEIYPTYTKEVTMRLH